MKAVLEFNLNERNEAVAHLRCVRNWELAWALHSVMEEINKTLREEGVIDGDKLLDSCWGIIRENNLGLDEMIY